MGECGQQKKLHTLFFGGVNNKYTHKYITDNHYISYYMFYNIISRSDSYMHIYIYMYTYTYT